MSVPFFPGRNSDAINLALLIRQLHAIASNKEAAISLCRGT
jgi:hypothetical protein